MLIVQNMNIILIVSLILVFSILSLLGFIFWNIFKSKKKRLIFYHKSKIFGENYFEQSDSK